MFLAFKILIPILGFIVSTTTIYFQIRILINLKRKHLEYQQRKLQRDLCRSKI